MFNYSKSDETFKWVQIHFTTTPTDSHYNFKPLLHCQNVNPLFIENLMNPVVLEKLNRFKVTITS